MYKLRNNVQTKVNKTLLNELPYYSCNLVLSYGRVNNILNTALPTKQYLDHLPSYIVYYDLDIFSLNTYVNKKSNFYDHTSNVRCKYYSPHGFSELKKNTIQNYNFKYVPTPLSAGGVGMYINEKFQYSVIDKCSNGAFQALFVFC